MTTRTFIVQIDPEDKDKRRRLVNALDMGLIADGARIADGRYEVTVRRLSKGEVAEQAAEEIAQADALKRSVRRKHLTDPPTCECGRLLAECIFDVNAGVSAHGDVG